MRELSTVQAIQEAPEILAVPVTLAALAVRVVAAAPAAAADKKGR